MKILKSRKLYIDENSLVIEIPEIKMDNLEEFGLIICQNIPVDCDENYKVIVKKSKDFIYLMSLSGNYVRADQIKTRTYYPIKYGVDPIHINIMRPIMNTIFNYRRD